ncbi:InlB B-repeat-containing protein [Butyrivibrio sp. WCD2001]|uniref:InlB B-repeat-containing protein n=1 Tax=Butyrivibrio sp. WCD2001 TaxID=1280681 RepID=UPI0004203277|nr:InlB B-repeat-containing protein [Butyrivibrio sp. WCD2001]
MKGKCLLSVLAMMMLLLFLPGNMVAKAEPNAGEKYTITFATSQGGFYNISSNGYYEATREQVIDAGSAIGTVAEPFDSYNNYLFDGWYKDSNYDEPISDIETFVPEGNMTIYANWRAVNEDSDLYVTVDFNGGTCNGSTSFIEYGDSDGKWYIKGGKTLQSTGMPNAYRENYGLTGWYTDAACTQQVTENTAITPGQTYYAGWTRECYSVTLDAGEGYFNQNPECKDEKWSIPVGSSMYLIGSVSGYTSDGKVIAGWYEDAALTKEITLVDGNYTPTEDVTVYAKWEPGYKVTFDYGIAADEFSSDEYTHSYYVKKNSKSDLYLTYMTGKTYGDYVFNGWYLDKDCTRYVTSFYDVLVSEDMTFYAKWSEKCTITYNAGDGKFYDGSKTMTVNIPQGEYFSTKYVTYANDSSKVCVGWSLTEGGQAVEINEITAYQDTTLYAVYEDGCEVTFDANGGTISYYMETTDNGGNGRTVNDSKLKLQFKRNAPLSSNLYVNYNGAICAVNDDNQMFRGWSTSKSVDDIVELYSYVPTGNSVTLYAIWGDRCTVTYDANGGYFYDNSQKSECSVASGERIGGYSIPSSDDAKIFSSWNTRADGKGETITDIYGYVVTEDVTFYAQWDDAYVITYDANGGYFVNMGTAVDTKYMYKIKKGQQTYMGSYNMKNSDSSLAFAGWSTSPDREENVQSNTSYTPNSDMTFYAVWKKGNKITYHANSDGGYFRYDGEDKTEIELTVPEGATIFGNYYYMPSYVNNDDNLQFSGYNTKPDGSGMDITYDFIPTGDMDIYAKWVKTYKMYLHANGGYYTSYNSNAGEYSDLMIVNCQQGLDAWPGSYSTLKHPSNMAFAGWSTTPDGKNTIDKVEKIDKDVYLYAVWEQGYQITFDGNGGKVYPGMWEEDFSDASALKDAVTVTLKKGRSLGYYEDGEITALRDGYVIGGWSTTPTGTKRIDFYETTPDKDMTLYAIWNKADKVTFDANGGKIYGSNNKTQITRQLADGSTLDWRMPHATNDNLGLVGWNTKADGTGTYITEETTISSDMTVYAIWDEGYTVTLDAGDGEMEVPSTHSYTSIFTDVVPKGKTIKLPICNIYSGEESFVGWYEDASFTKKVYEYDPDNGGIYYEYKPTKDVTLYAKYEKGYTITFNGNAGWVFNNDEKTYDVAVRKGKKLGREIWAYTDEGDDQSSQGFAGWYMDPECKTLVATRTTIEDYVPTGDITLYAGFIDGEVKVKGVSLGKTNATLGVGDSFNLSVVVKPFNATNAAVNFESSNFDVAEVDEEGNVTGKSEGSAVITVTTVDGGFTAQCEITVDGKNAEQIAGGIDTAMNKLEQQKQNHETAQMKKTVEESLKGLGTVDSMADKVESNGAIAEKLEKLEETYTEAAGVTVVQPSEDEQTKETLKEVFGDDVNTNAASVSGAGLNAAPEQTAKLSIEPTTEENQKAVGEEFNSVAQIDMSLKVGDGNAADEELHELVAPITITLPMPKNILGSRLYVLHYYADGTYELIKPKLVNNTMVITVSHFSTFAIVELAEGEAVTNNNGNGNGNEDAAQPAKAAETPQPSQPSQPAAVANDTAAADTTPAASTSADTASTSADTADNSKKDDDDPTKARITQDKQEINASKVAKKNQKITVKIDRSKGKITAKNVSSKKLKKYLDVKVKGKKVICTVKKGAKKGTYKVKITVDKNGKYKKTTKTITIVVK